MNIFIIRKKITPDELRRTVLEAFGDMVKVDVDIVRRLLVVGGEWHSEGQDLLVKDGSNGADVWGCNFYPFREIEKRIEYNSLINLKPAFGARDMTVRDVDIRNKMREIIEELLLAENETIQR